MGALDVRWCGRMSLLGGLAQAAGGGYNGLAQNHRMLINSEIGTFSVPSVVLIRSRKPLLAEQFLLSYRLQGGFLLLLFSFCSFFKKKKPQQAPSADLWYSHCAAPLSATISVLLRFSLPLSPEFPGRLQHAVAP